MSDDILHELKADWMECACFEGSLSVDREVIDQAAAEIERLRARVEVLESDRRERIATACLAGLFANPQRTGNYSADYANAAVQYADALIARLDREAKP